MTDKLLIDRTTIAQVLEALEAGPDVDPIFAGETQDALCAALAQQPEPAQEPVAWMVYTEGGTSAYVTDNPNDLVGAYCALPIYTTPPQRPRLTDEEIAEATAGVLGLPHEIKVELARAVERKVRGE